MSVDEAAIREDLRSAHAAVLAHWAAPGGWWTGAERLAIVAETRRARAAEPLPPWVAPSTVAGLVDPRHPLPAAAIDVVWRLTNHPATMTAAVHETALAAGLDPFAYVELVGVIATATALDTFRAALGLAPYPLPEPAEGEPRREAVPEAAVTTHWVPTMPGEGVNVMRALSADRDGNAVRARLAAAQYVPIDAIVGDLTWGREALDRRQIELVAARTSALNECFY